jgi:hypothetical protein
MNSLHSVRLTLLDLNDLIEVGLRVALTSLDFPFDQLVVGGIDVFVERRGNLLDPERRQKAVICHWCRIRP